MSINLVEMFYQIEAYHQELGYDVTKMTETERLTYLRGQALGLFQEVAELVNAFPWKPWRPISSQVYDFGNAVEEVIDCLFFLVGICEAGKISSQEVETVFQAKLAANYARILSGYNNKPEERG